MTTFCAAPGRGVAAMMTRMAGSLARIFVVGTLILKSVDGFAVGGLPPAYARGGFLGRVERKQAFMEVAGAGWERSRAPVCGGLTMGVGYDGDVEVTLKRNFGGKFFFKGVYTSENREKPKEWLFQRTYNDFVKLDRKVRTEEELSKGVPPVPPEPFLLGEESSPKPFQEYVDAVMAIPGAFTSPIVYEFVSAPNSVLAEALSDFEPIDVEVNGELRLYDDEVGPTLDPVMLAAKAGKQYKGVSQALSQAEIAKNSGKAAAEVAKESTKVIKEVGKVVNSRSTGKTIGGELEWASHWPPRNQVFQGHCFLYTTWAMTHSLPKATMAAALMFGTAECRVTDVFLFHFTCTINSTQSANQHSEKSGLSCFGRHLTLAPLPTPAGVIGNLRAGRGIFGEKATLAFSKTAVKTVAQKAGIEVPEYTDQDRWSIIISGPGGDPMEVTVKPTQKASVLLKAWKAETESEAAFALSGGQDSSTEIGKLVKDGGTIKVVKA